MRSHQSILLEQLLSAQPKGGGSFVFPVQAPPQKSPRNKHLALKEIKLALKKIGLDTLAVVLTLLFVIVLGVSGGKSVDWKHLIQQPVLAVEALVLVALLANQRAQRNHHEESRFNCFTFRGHGVVVVLLPVYEKLLVGLYCICVLDSIILMLPVPGGPHWCIAYYHQKDPTFTTFFFFYVHMVCNSAAVFFLPFALFVQPTATFRSVRGALALGTICSLLWAIFPLLALIAKLEYQSDPVEFACCTCGNMIPFLLYARALAEGRMRESGRPFAILALIYSLFDIFGSCALHRFYPSAAFHHKLIVTKSVLYAVAVLLFPFVTYWCLRADTLHWRARLTESLFMFRSGPDPVLPDHWDQFLLDKLLECSFLEDDALCFLDYCRLKKRTKIGEGATCQVYCGTIDDTCCVALKIFNLSLADDNMIKQLHQEALILTEINRKCGSHVAIGFYGVSVRPPDIVFVFELAKQSLLDHVLETRPTPRDRLLMCSKMAQLVAKLHNYKIIHCDIKPQNFLVTKDNSLRIADFGNAFILKPAQTHKIQSEGGTREYCAPETMCPDSREFSKASDVYSLGVSMLQVMAYAEPCPELLACVATRGYANNQHLNLNLGVDDVLSSKFLELISNTLQQDPNSRNCAANLERLLSALAEEIVEV